MMKSTTYSTFPSIRARNQTNAVKSPNLHTSISYNNWPQFWGATSRSLRASGYQKSTLILYRHVIRSFSRFTGKPPCHITSHDIRNYLRSLTGKSCTWHWTGMNISVLRTVFDKLADLNALQNVRGPKRKQSRPEFLSRAEIGQLLGAATTLRDQLIISLLYGCGLKVGELQKIRWQDIHSEEGFLVITSRWNQGIRRLPLPKAILPILREGKKRCRSDQHVFPGAKGDSPLRSRTIELIIRKCAETAFKTTIQNPHSKVHSPITSMTLRHSYAVHELEAGTSVRHVQEALDHRHVETTMRYITCLPTAIVQSPLDKISESLKSAPTEAIVIQDPTPVLADLPFPLLDPRTHFVSRLKMKLTSRFLAMRNFFISG